MYMCHTFLTTVCIIYGRRWFRDGDRRQWTDKSGRRQIEESKAVQGQRAKNKLKYDMHGISGRPIEMLMLVCVTTLFRWSVVEATSEVLHRIYKSSAKDLTLSQVNQNPLPTSYLFGTNFNTILTFRRRASSIPDRRFATIQRTLFIYLINKYISLSDICLTVNQRYK